MKNIEIAFYSFNMDEGNGDSLEVFRLFFMFLKDKAF